MGRPAFPLEIEPHGPAGQRDQGRAACALRHRRRARHPSPGQGAGRHLRRWARAREHRPQRPGAQRHHRPRQVPVDRVRSRRRRQEGPRHPARSAARSGQGLADPRRFPAHRRRRAHPRQRAGAVRQREPVAGPQARRRLERGAPRDRGDLPGRRHPGLLRVQSRGARDRPLGAHLGHQDARGRHAHHPQSRLHGGHHRRPQDRGGAHARCRGGRCRRRRACRGRGGRARRRGRCRCQGAPGKEGAAAKAPAGKEAAGAKPAAGKPAADRGKK